MKRTCSFHPVALCLVLFGLVLLPIFGCIATTELPDTVTTTDNPNSEEPIDDSDEGELYDYWIQQMDPYVIENADWTYDFDQSAFLSSLVASHLDVYDYYVNAGSATADTVVIDVLIDGFSIVNDLILQQDTSGEARSVFYRFYWWGYKQCYTGGSAAVMLSVMTAGGAVYAVYGGRIAAAVVTYYVGQASINYGVCGGFCFNIPWAFPTISSLSCP